MNDKFTLEISWTALWRIFFFSIFVAILYLAGNVLVVVALAIIFSSALDPFVSFLQRKKVPRMIGAILSFILVLILIGLVVYIMAPIFVFEFRRLIDDVNKLTFELFGLGIPKNIIKQLNFNFDNIFNLLTSGNVSFFDYAASFLGNAAFTLIGIIITFYLTIQKNGVERFLLAVLPFWCESIAVKIFQNTKKKIGRWLGAQLFLGIIIGLTVFVSLWFLGVRYSFALGFVAMVLEIFPVVGPIFAGATAVLVALSDSGILAIYTILTFIVIQQIEATLLVPAVMSRMVGLNSVTVLIALMIGSKVFGFMGLILAVPAAVLFQELMENWTRYKIRQPNLEV